MSPYPPIRPGSALLRLAVALLLLLSLDRFGQAGRAAPRTAFADSYVVTSLADSGPGSLRETIAAANASAGPDTITFSVAGTIVLSSTLTSITDRLTIDGGQSIVLDGNDNVRVIRSAAPLTLTALTVQNGSATEGAGALFTDAGTLIDTTFVSNTASGGGGGALFESTATITGTSFLSNTAASGNGGGALFNEAVTITGTTFASNTAPGGEGGGAFFAKAAAVTGAAFTTNSAQLGGGARFGGQAQVAGTTFLSNTATASHGGGARFGSEAVLTSTTFLSNTANTGSGGGARFDGAATLGSVTFTGNSASGTGGGASFDHTAALTGATFVANSGTTGGGGADFAQTAALTTTAFLTNTAPSGSGGGASFTGVATLNDTTFAGNSAGGAGGGGARFLSTATVTGGSFEANTATNGTGGGARILGTATVARASFLRNQAVDGGGLYLDNGASLSLDNSLLAANSATGASGADEITLAGDNTGLTGRHNTLAAEVPGSGLALSAGNGTIGQSVALANSIFDGYAVGVLAGASAPAMALEGVLWSDVTTPTQGAGIAVTAAVTGSADFVDPAGDDYHLQRSSDAFNAAEDAGLAEDFDGDARPQYAVFDLGFDELLNAHAPQAVGDADTTPEDTFVTVEVLDNDSDGDGDALSLSAVGLPNSGAAAISGGEIVYTPAANFNGQAVFTYTVTDGGLNGTASVTVTVNPVPDVPTAVDDEAGTPEDTPITLRVLDNDLEPDGDTLSVSAVGTPSMGAAAISGTTQIVYAPPPNLSGLAVFTYTLSDGTFTRTAAVSVTVSPVNDAPTISGLSDVHLPSGGATEPLAFTVDDVESGSTLTVTASSSNLALVPNANIILAGNGSARTVTILPAGLSGQTLIVLTVTDADGGTAQTQFTVRVGFQQMLPILLHFSN